MLKFIPSKDSATVAIEFSGKINKEDINCVDQYVKEHFGDDQTFNYYIVIQDMDGATLKGWLEGFKEDMRRWKQYNRVAMISEKNWVEAAMKLMDYLPGITAKYFDQNQTEEAWNWIKQ